MRLTHSPALILAILIFAGRVAADEFDPAPTYYNTATGTGATLKQQLHDIIDGHTVRSYDSLRTHLQVTDADVAHPGHMFTVYDRTSLNVAAINPEGSIPGWDAGTTWNREHTWPQSRGVGSGGPDSSDLFNIRPALAANNGDRGNNNFGGAFGQEFGDVTDNGATQWYPGDAEAGMIARQAFYMAVRYDGSDANTTNLELFAGNPTTAQGMGDLNRLIQWNYLAIPDDFERRRNEIIYDSYQFNRNPFTDHPEWAWSVFVDQQNDTQLTLAGSTPGTNGASTIAIDLGRIIVGAPTPAAQTVTIDKGGADGTYFSVSTSGQATSSLGGRYNAFGLGAIAGRSLQAGLNTNTSLPGHRTGTITIDNLDVTTEGGAGRGANDANDLITVTLDIFEHAAPSFAEIRGENALTIDFGTLSLGATVSQVEFSLFNPSGIVTTDLFTARLELDSILASGAASTLTTSLTAFGGVDALGGGDSRSFLASFDTSAAGTFAASYTLSFSDEDLPGATALQDLTLNLIGTVEAMAIVSADFHGDGDVDGADFFSWQRGVGITEGASRAQGDANGDGAVDASDLAEWSRSFGESPQLVVTIPEPTTIALVGLVVLPIAHRRYSASRRSM